MRKHLLHCHPKRNCEPTSLNQTVLDFWGEHIVCGRPNRHIALQKQCLTFQLRVFKVDGLQSLGDWILVQKRTELCFIVDSTAGMNKHKKPRRHLKESEKISWETSGDKYWIFVSLHRPVMPTHPSTYDASLEAARMSYTNICIRSDRGFVDSQHWSGREFGYDRVNENPAPST